MARIRTIKPEFWSSPAMKGLDPWSRLLFIAMWNWADDSGRGTAHPRELAGFAFQWDDDIDSADIRRMLGEIRRAFGVVFYEVAGRPYYLIPSWDRHQKIDKRSGPKYPGPEEGSEWNPSGALSSWSDSDQQGRRREQEFGGTSAGSAEDSPNTRGDLGAGTGEQGNRGITTRPPDEPADTDVLFGADLPAIPSQTQASGRAKLTDAQAQKSPEWQEFWYKAFPRREGRAPALKAWVKALNDGRADAKTIIAGAYAYTEREQRKGTDPTKIKMAQGWLNDSRWEDEGPAQPGARPQPGAPIPADEKCLIHRGHRKATCRPCADEAEQLAKATP